MVDREYLHPEYSIEELKVWFRRYAFAYTSVPEWLVSMRKFDVVVGTRIHGVMAGIQAGIPGICLCIDSRTLELCQTMCIPYLNAYDHINGLTLNQIESKLRDWNWRAYDEVRFQLATKLKNFATWNNLKVYTKNEN